MDRGARSWVTIFSQRIHPMLLQEIFQTPFSNNNKEKERKTYQLVACQKHTQTDSSRIFKRMVPVDYYQSKKKYQEPFLSLVQ